MDVSYYIPRRELAPLGISLSIAAITDPDHTTEISMPTRMFHEASAAVLVAATVFLASAISSPKVSLINPFEADVNSTTTEVIKLCLKVI